MNVLVLKGGFSDESEVSYRSGASVTAALKAAGHTVTEYDPKDGLDVLEQYAKTHDVVFPVLHGEWGEDGQVQELLESWNVAFVGSGSEASKKCIDKNIMRGIAQKNNFNVASGKIINKDTIWNDDLITRPFVLKPNFGGSSIDTFIVRDVANIDKDAINEALGRYENMLLESLISGNEITVAVLDKKALPVIEIIPPAEGEFDYTNKYNGATKELCPPVNINAEVQQAAQRLAEQLHELFGCSQLSRIDFIVDENNQPILLEINTIPGMTAQSLYPKAAMVSGLDMPTLTDRLVTNATH